MNAAMRGVAQRRWREGQVRKWPAERAMVDAGTMRVGVRTALPAARFLSRNEVRCCELDLTGQVHVSS